MAIVLGLFLLIMKGDIRIVPFVNHINANVQDFFELDEYIR